MILCADYMILYADYVWSTMQTIDPTVYAAYMILYAD